MDGICTHFTDDDFVSHNSYSLKHYGHVCMCPDCIDHRTYERETLCYRRKFGLRGEEKRIRRIDLYDNERFAF